MLHKNSLRSILHAEKQLFSSANSSDFLNVAKAMYRKSSLFSTETILPSAMKNLRSEFFKKVTTG